MPLAHLPADFSFSAFPAGPEQQPPQRAFCADIPGIGNVLAPDSPVRYPTLLRFRGTWGPAAKEVPKGAGSTDRGVGAPRPAVPHGWTRRAPRLPDRATRLRRARRRNGSHGGPCGGSGAPRTVPPGAASPPGHGVDRWSAAAPADAATPSAPGRPPRPPQPPPPRRLRRRAAGAGRRPAGGLGSGLRCRGWAEDGLRGRSPAAVGCLPGRRTCGAVVAGGGWVHGAPGACGSRSCRA